MKKIFFPLLLGATVSACQNGQKQPNVLIFLTDVFKESGYQTGCFGKWHNGAYYPYSPNGQGFDEFLGFSDGLSLNYFDSFLQHNEEQVREKGFITDIFTDKAIQLIRAIASIYAMVENVDYNISRILDKLEQLDVAENTIVVFMSDNGPTAVRRYNGDMRGQKSTVYEGGLRVPCFFRWKGNINHRIINEPTSIVDIMPTLLSLCGTCIEVIYRKCNVK